MAVCRFVAVRGVLGRARGARVVLVDGMARVVGSRACFSVLASTREGALAASVCIPVFLFREFLVVRPTVRTHMIIPKASDSDPTVIRQ